MFLFVKAPQRDVVQLLAGASAFDATVGPMSASGWSAAWVDTRPDDEPDLGERFFFVRIDEYQFATRVVVRDGAGPIVTVTEANSREAASAAAATLGAMFNSWNNESDLEALLRDREQDVESLATILSQLLPLPVLLEIEPDHVVVLTRLGLRHARMAAGIAGPAWLLETTAGWRPVVPANSDNGEVAAAFASGTRRRERTLMLWRSGRTCGVTVWRRGRVEADWAWHEPWVRVGPDRMADERATCAALAAVAATDDVHLPALRSLLRAEQPDGDPLVTLVHLLGLPPRFLSILDAGQAVEQWSDAEHVPVMSSTQAWRAATTSVEPRSRWRRVVYACYAIGTVLSAAVSAAMALLGVAVIVTDGSAIDQDGSTGSDWAFTAFFAVLSLILIPTARFRLRRVRETRE